MDDRYHEYNVEFDAYDGARACSFGWGTRKAAEMQLLALRNRYPDGNKYGFSNFRIVRRNKYRDDY